MYERLDEALSTLHNYAPEWNEGLSNHGSIVAETMITLRRGDHIKPWIDNYIKRLSHHPGIGNPFEGDQWKTELGNYDRFSDWLAFFRQQIQTKDWTAVLKDWIPILSPGLSGGGTHGLIRTAHCVRSLPNEVTPIKLNELAESLAYWAARYQAISSHWIDNTGDRLPSQVMGSLPLLEEEQGEVYLISGGIARAAADSLFDKTIQKVDLSVDPSYFISDCTSVMALAYLANADNSNKTDLITWIHAITAPSAMRLLLPYVDEEGIPILLKSVWQATAAIYSWKAKNPMIMDVPVYRGDLETLIDRAIQTGDEHAIKLTEVAIREASLGYSPVYYTVADKVIKRMVG
jgi:hypothetical protein